MLRSSLLLRNRECDPSICVNVYIFGVLKYLQLYLTVSNVDASGEIPDLAVGTFSLITPLGRTVEHSGTRREAVLRESLVIHLVRPKPPHGEESTPLELEHKSNSFCPVPALLPGEFYLVSLSLSVLTCVSQMHTNCTYFRGLLGKHVIMLT